MAKNTGDDSRKGAVKERSQVKSPANQEYTKRDSDSGEFTEQKDNGKPFKGVRKEKKTSD